MKTLADLIEGFKESNKVAVIDRKEYRKFAYTYKELYKLSSKFAYFLKKNKVNKGDMIIVWSYNGIEYAIMLLGAFLAGVIVVPVDLRSDIVFARKIQNIVQAKLVFQTRHKPKLKQKTVFVEELLDSLEEGTYSTDVNENDIAEIIYTSGTTGNPKGVILTHKNFISNLNAINSVEKVKSKFKFLSVLPLSHVFEQMTGFFVPLSQKASIVYVKTLKPSSLFEAFEDEKITNAAFVPRILELIYSGILQEVKKKNKENQFFIALKAAKYIPFSLRKLLFRKIHKKLGNNINYFISGGATLNEELERFYNSIGILVIQGYGLTETSPILTANTTKKHKIGSVGRAITGVEVSIKNGEVVAKGDNITQGYYKNPTKTKELFEDGWLKTGDLGRFDNEGFLYLKGRKKDVIVTAAGINVYAEDIENILNKIEGVADSCVIGMDGKKGEEVYAVLLLKEGAKAKNIVDKANEKLDSSQKIKDYSVWPYEDFPRTTTLKIKKFAVKEALKTKKEAVIVKKKNKIYSIISQLTNKKITDAATLQDLGLSSIDIVELISLLEQEFNIEIDEERMIPSTKIKELEQIIKQKIIIEEKPIFKHWALSLAARFFRFVLQPLTNQIARFFSWPRIYGRENLKGLKSPVIFAANHQSHFDTPIILMKLPLRFSLKTAVAAWQEFFFRHNLKYKGFGKWLLYHLATIFYNIYPFPQQKGFRRSLKYTGRLVGKEWNILIYPEGARTMTGEIQSFKQGIGILAVEMGIPVVPIKVENVIKVLPRWKRFPKFARTKVNIGKPIIVKHGSYIRATEEIEKAVKEL